MKAMADPHLVPPLHGIIPPMVTPLIDRDALDHAGLERLVPHILSGGVAGLFVLGTTGEAPSLSYRVRCELVERSGELVAGRVPLLVGITDTSLTESIELAERACDAGAVAVVAAPPPYYPISQAELLHHFDRLAAELPLPLVLYNMPGCTKTALEPDTVLRLSELPGVIGLKDSSGDLDYFRRVRQLLPDRERFPLFVGPEELLVDAVSAGADGGVYGGTNVFPRLYTELYRAARAGSAARVQQLHAIVMQVSATLYCFGRHASRVIKGIKGALRHMEICSDAVAEPFQPLTSGERQQIAKSVDAIREQISMVLGAEAVGATARTASG